MSCPLPLYRQTVALPVWGRVFTTHAHVYHSRTRPRVIFDYAGTSADLHGQRRRAGAEMSGCAASRQASQLEPALCADPGRPSFQISRGLKMPTPLFCSVRS